MPPYFLCQVENRHQRCLFSRIPGQDFLETRFIRPLEEGRLRILLLQHERIGGRGRSVPALQRTDPHEVDPPNLLFGQIVLAHIPRPAGGS